MPTNIVAQLARMIRRKYPQLKFRIRRAVLSGAFATTHLIPESGMFIVTIGKEVKPDLAAFLLAHEISHAISWHADTDEHGDAFWAAYRRVYAIYEAFASS
jgi:Zn-dependent peptidase ImmA (M78 family)